jgi:class 3 adenylate cyclase
MWGTAVNLAHRLKDGMSTPGIYVSARVYDALSETMSFTSGRHRVYRRHAGIGLATHGAVR